MEDGIGRVDESTGDDAVTREGESSIHGLVSIVLPAFDAERYIATAIEGVLSQTHDELELVIVDDGSTDGTAEIAASFDDPRITVMAGAHGGAAAARNRGLEQARGETVAFLDADDYWLPHKLDAQLRVLAEDPTVVAVGCLMHYVSPSGRRIGTAGWPPSARDHVDIESGKQMPFPLSSVLWRRSALAGAGRFDEQLRHAEDIDLLARVARRGSIACVAEVLGGYRVHAGSVSAAEMAAQRKARRFVEARIRAAREGRTLTVTEFEAGYRPGINERRSDLVAASYRAAAVAAAEKSWSAALGRGAVAALLGPRYTIARLARQKPWRRFQSQRPDTGGRR